MEIIALASLGISLTAITATISGPHLKDKAQNRQKSPNRDTSSESFADSGNDTYKS